MLKEKKGRGMAANVVLGPCLRFRTPHLPETLRSYRHAADVFMKFSDFGESLAEQQLNKALLVDQVCVRKIKLLVAMPLELRCFRR